MDAIVFCCISVTISLITFKIDGSIFIFSSARETEKEDAEIIIEKDRIIDTFLNALIFTSSSQFNLKISPVFRIHEYRIESQFFSSATFFCQFEIINNGYGQHPSAASRSEAAKNLTAALELTGSSCGGQADARPAYPPFLPA
jgi:hypothetical protein